MESLVQGAPEEMANIYAFLASDEASYVTGSLWLADEGVTPAKGCLGGKAPAELRRAPAGVLPLRHSHDGENGKEIFRAKKQVAVERSGASTSIFRETVHGLAATPKQ
jgi:hypothetical protein